MGDKNEEGVRCDRAHPSSHLCVPLLMVCKIVTESTNFLLTNRAEYGIVPLQKGVACTAVRCKMGRHPGAMRPAHLFCGKTFTEGNILVR